MTGKKDGFLCRCSICSRNEISPYFVSFISRVQLPGQCIKWPNE